MNVRYLTQPGFISLIETVDFQEISIPEAALGKIVRLQRYTRSSLMSSS